MAQEPGEDLFAGFEDAGDDVATDPEPDPRRRRRNGRYLLLVCSLAAVVIVVLGAVGLVAVRHYLDDTASPTAAISVRYQREYRACVDAGGGRGPCAGRASRHCIADPHWLHDTRPDDQVLADVSSVCRFGPGR